MPRENSTAKISGLAASFLALAMILVLSACGGKRQQHSHGDFGNDLAYLGQRSNQYID